jgi:hypothetical protein
MKPRLSATSVLVLAILGTGGCNFQSGGTTAAGATPGESPTQTPKVFLAQSATSTPDAVLTVLPTDATPEASPSPDYSSAPCNSAQLIADVSIPAGWQIGPSKAFTKIWRLKNTGSCAWTADYSLVFDDGDQMNAKPSYPIAAGAVPPGGTVDLSVEMVSPAGTGSFQGIFRLRTADGSIFGPGKDGTLRVSIVVVLGEPELATYQAGSSVAVPPGRTGDVTAECPVGTIATGGGFNGDKSMTAHFMGLSGNGWRVAAVNPADSGQTLTAYAVCLVNSTGMTVTQVTDDKPVYPGAGGQSNVTCPDGSVVSGIGYSVDPAAMVVTGGDRMGIVARIFAWNKSDSMQTLRGQPACLTPFTQVSYLPIHVERRVPGRTVTTIEAECPPSTFLTGGSFDFHTPEMRVINLSKKPGTDIWTVTADNPTDSYQWLISFAICMNIAMM